MVGESERRGRGRNGGQGFATENEKTGTSRASRLSIPALFRSYPIPSRIALPFMQNIFSSFLVLLKQLHFIISRALQRSWPSLAGSRNTTPSPRERELGFPRFYEPHGEEERQPAAEGSSSPAIVSYPPYSTADSVDGSCGESSTSSASFGPYFAAV